MTLNTINLAGKVDVSITLGLPLLRELCVDALNDYSAHTKEPGSNQNESLIFLLIELFVGFLRRLQSQSVL